MQIELEIQEDIGFEIGLRLTILQSQIHYSRSAGGISGLMAPQKAAEDKSIISSLTASSKIAYWIQLFATKSIWDLITGQSMLDFASLRK